MKLVGVLAILFGIVLVFIGSCIVTLSHGRGAHIFLFTVPILLALLLWAFFRLSSLPKRNRRAKTILRSVVAGEFLFLVLFFSSVAAPSFRFFSRTVVGVVGAGFEMVTGFSPYVWFRQNRTLAKQLNQKFAGARDELRVEQLSIGKPWQRICFLGPYTSEEEAAKILGFSSATMERSRARTSDSFVALVFVDEKGVVEVIDIWRGALDLVSLSHTCLKASDFPLPLKTDVAGHRFVSHPPRF